MSLSVQDQGVRFTKDIGLGTHTYNVDWSKFVRQTTPILRSRPDQSNEPGEQAISYENVWPRSQHDWKLGAGQRYFDEDDASRHRFDQSLNLEVFQRRKIGLISETVLHNTLGGSGATKGTMAGPYGYVYKGTTLKYTLSPTSTWFSVTGLGAAGKDITATGAHVYVGTASGIYRAGLGSGSASLFSAFALNGSIAWCIGAANGRLLAGNDTRLVEIDSAGAYGAVGQLDFTHPLGLCWTVIAGAPNGIYVGSAGFGSDIYLLTVNPNTGGLVPTLAMTLPVGEQMTAMIFYGGVMVLGTTRGFRLANISGDGSLIYGPLVKLGIQDGSSGHSTYPGAYAFYGRGEFVWVSWANPIWGYQGAGRIDLGRFTEPLVPAYATDLMIPPAEGWLGTGTYPSSILGFEATVPEVPARISMTFSDMYGTHNTNKAATGWFRTGQITFGTTERKSPVAFDWRTQPLPAGSSITWELSVNGGDFFEIASDDVTDSEGPTSPIAISGANAGEDFELRCTFTRGTDTTTTPWLLRWTLRTMPTPPRVDEIILPITFAGVVDGDDGFEILDNPLDGLTEYLYLKDAELQGTVLDLTIGTRTDSVKIDQIKEEVVKWNDDRTYFNGTVTLRCLTVVPVSELP